MVESTFKFIYFESKLSPCLLLNIQHHIWYLKRGGQHYMSCLFRSHTKKKKCTRSEQSGCARFFEISQIREEVCTCWWPSLLWLVPSPCAAAGYWLDVWKRWRPKEESGTEITDPPGTTRRNTVLWREKVVIYTFIYSYDVYKVSDPNSCVSFRVTSTICWPKGEITPDHLRAFISLLPSKE